MSHKKVNIEQSSKPQLYQTMSVSEKNIPGKNIDKTLTHLLHLNQYINESKIEELKNYIQEEKISDPKEIGNIIKELLKKYESTNKNFYIMLDILLNTGWPINYEIEISQKDYPKLFNNLNYEENEINEMTLTLLTLAIILDDEEFVKTVLNYHDINTINKPDNKGLCAIVYSILYNKNDKTNILELLLKKGADIDRVYKINIGPNKYLHHSIFTLACSQNLPNVIKYLIDNTKVYVNYGVTPTGDTGLHICARGGMENALKILLSCDEIDPDIYNSQGQKAQEVVADNEKKNEIIKLFVNYYNNQSAKKTDMNNNASMQKNNNQSSYMNKLNKNNLNNDQKNLNNISQNENYLNNNNLLNKNKMLNKSNNSDQNQSRPNMNIENMNNNESSDFSGEIPNANISGNNIYFNKIQHSPKLLNQNIYNNLISETNNPNAVFNVEIPIVMGNKNKVHYKSGNRALSNFFAPKTNSIPVLNLDMNDKTFQLELEINELNSQITEIEKESKKIEEEIRKDEEEINKKKNDLEKKGDRLKQSNNDILKCNQELENLKKTQEEILSQIPEGKVYKGSNKNGNKKLLKFSLNEIDDTEMFKILNKDLLDYQMYKTEIIRRQNIVFQIENRINEIKTIIKNLADNYDVQIYGSYALDLNMDWSDIDLILIRNDNQENNDNNNNNNDDNILIEQPNANELQNDNISVANTDSTRDTLLLNPINNNVNQINDTNILDYLSQAISHLNWVRSVKIRENLEVKILRAECILVNQNDSKKLDIDISVKTEKHFGLECVDLINTYLKEYSVLKPITIALRAILHSANLHLPEKGGLSAYGLILMVVSYIQSQKENFTKNEPYLCGKIFYGFLRHYGIMFDFNKYLILTYTGNESNGYNNTTDKDTLNLNQYGQEFIILDPLNNKNNVASNSFQFMNLKMAFMIAYMVTKEDCDCGCHFGEAEFENSFQSTEHCYLKRMLNSVRRFQG